MADNVPESTHDLLAYIEESPTPWHCVVETAQRLERGGFVELTEDAVDWPLTPGLKGYVVRDGGSIVAFRMGARSPAAAGFRLVGAHTDSPNLRLKSKPDVTSEGYALLGVQTYGGVLLHTWFDRDLGLAGRVTLRVGANPLQLETRLIRIDRPIGRIPNLAIHLNREIRDSGFKPNKQKHLPLVWGFEGDDRPALATFLASEMGVDASNILGWDLCLYDVQPPSVGGVHEDFIYAPRLDNQASCHAALLALIDGGDALPDTTAVVTLFDHEEIGSRTSRGAAGSLTRDVLGRLVGEQSKDLTRATSRSVMISADMAHGVHPNYADKHEPNHKPMLNAGPVVKTHADWRYATETESSAVFRGLCGDLGVPTQEFINRSDLACGSTIGPIVSSSLGIRAVDVGNAMWSMHSIREMAGSRDHELMVRAMTGFLGWDERF
jgi:aspartyl aminopeptidase